MKATELLDEQLDSVVGGMSSACKKELMPFTINGDIKFVSSSKIGEYVKKCETAGTFDDDLLAMALDMAKEYGSVTVVGAKGSKSYSFDEFSKLMA